VDSQTNKQTNKNRQKHYLRGGGKNDRQIETQTARNTDIYIQTEKQGHMHTCRWTSETSCRYLDTSTDLHKDRERHTGTYKEIKKLTDIQMDRQRDI